MSKKPTVLMILDGYGLNERKDHKGIDRDFFRYNICCNAACASDSGDIYTIAFILGAPYSEALCGFSAAYIQRPSI